MRLILTIILLVVATVSALTVTADYFYQKGMQEGIEKAITWKAKNKHL